MNAEHRTPNAELRRGKRTCGLTFRVAPGGYPPGAPTDPYVRALAHTVPQGVDSRVLRPTRTLSDGVPFNMDTRFNALTMCLAIGSTPWGRMGPTPWCLAFLDRVRRVAFPCFLGSIKALRLPTVHPAALRFLRLAVPRLDPVFAPVGPGRPASGPGVVGFGYPTTDSPWRRLGLPSSWGTPIARLRTFSDPGRTAVAHQIATVAWPPLRRKQRLPRWSFRGSIAWLSGSLSTLRRSGCPETTQDSLPGVG